MSQRRRAADNAERAAQAHQAIRGSRRVTRERARVDITLDSPSAKVQRLLVLADRFRAMSQRRTDPAGLADVLRNVIALGRDVFGTKRSSDWNARLLVQTRPEEVQWMRDLERLLQGLSHGSPESLRDLGHAMDGLLIQCVLFETPPGDAERRVD